MGRPLNKRYFGEPTAGGNEIKVQFHNGTASVPGWIVKQKASKRFLCTDGTNEAVCTLVDKPSASLAAGEMSITVKDDAGNAKQVVKIAGRKVTVDTGESIAWNFSTSTTDGKVEIEEAGDDASMTNATDLAGDETPIVATALVSGTEYSIVTTGTTDFTLIGAADSNPGTVFTATAAGTGTGTAVPTAA